MNLKSVETNFGGFITDASEKTLKVWMWEYIRAYLRMDDSHTLAGSKFSWTPIRFVHHASTRVGEAMIPVKERKDKK